MKKIEKIVIKRRNAIVRTGRRMFANAIKSQYEQAIEVIQSADLDHIADRITRAVTAEPIDRVFGKYYSEAADIAMIWRNYHKPPQKAGEDAVYKAHFQRTLMNYGRVKAGQRINDITKTTEKYIVDIVESAVTQGMDEGLGVAAVRDIIYAGLKENYSELTTGRAQLIAQTEMITASNQAAMEGTRSLGLEFRKFWSTSGIGNSRESHVQAEQDSIDQGGLMEDELFSNGLSFPGDPMGDASEVCNCRCTLLTEIV